MPFWRRIAARSSERPTREDSFARLAAHPHLDSIPGYAWVDDLIFYGEFVFTVPWSIGKIEMRDLAQAAWIRNTLQKNRYLHLWAGGNQFFSTKLNYASIRARVVAALDARSLTEEQFGLLRAIAEHDPSWWVRRAARTIIAGPR